MTTALWFYLWFIGAAVFVPLGMCIYEDARAVTFGVFWPLLIPMLLLKILFSFINTEIWK